MRDQFYLLLADDDKDDGFFFSRALQKIPIATHLTIVDDGEKLMMYLNKNLKQLPDVLFLDLNMPRKNGSECLVEIKKDEILKELPVVIYSTSLYEDTADLLYKNGAHYYIRKGSLEGLEKGLHFVLNLLEAKKFSRPSRELFIPVLPK
ncbi:MAG: response regulator [Cyclobacteriaceae bacterium]